MNRTNVVLDMQLIEQAKQVTGLKTIRAVIDTALRQIIAREQRQKILLLKGRLRWHGDLNAWRQER